MATSLTTCNLNCICINSDCIYKHYIQYKDRKIVKKFYDELNDKNVKEENDENRKKNCTYGQLCENKKCGFRHRLSFNDREKLIVLYKFNNICPSASKKTSKVVSEPKKDNTSSKNAFMILDDINDDEIKEEIKEPVYSGKSWVSVVKTEEKKEWGDYDDDDFYMKF